ncbi:hypothetical protein GCM10009789_01370 [Kribbella sancticallisti]|uniref:Major facilitator superfamily (MFS) profile domain-containing protein n=1 Tax=Kribbella sancticallisti TaxID=460087 RepID=A0ABN2C3C3_9ACTN
MEQRYGGTDTMTEPNVSSATQRYEEARAAAERAMTTVTVVPDRPPTQGAMPIDVGLPPYRGFKFGAAFFGWLVMLSMAALITVLIAGAGIGISNVLDYTRADAERQAGTAAMVAAAVLVLAVSIAFYTGGYVAGRLARFDGARQGFGVWMFSLLLAALAAGLGAYANSLYDLVDRVDRPDVPLSNDDLLTGGLITAAALLMLPLLAALLGGKTGQRYHDKIDDLLD